MSDRLIFLLLPLIVAGCMVGPNERLPSDWIEGHWKLHAIERGTESEIFVDRATENRGTFVATGDETQGGEYWLVSRDSSARVLVVGVRPTNRSGHDQEWHFSTDYRFAQIEASVQDLILGKQKVGTIDAFWVDARVRP